MQTQINLRTLKAVALAAGNEETRYYLCGVLVECRETRVTYVATNGHVLLCAQEDLPPLEPGEAPRLIGNWIVPSATIKAVKLNGKSKWAGDLAPMRKLDEKQFILGGAVFTPVDGSFPDWRRVMPGAVKGIGAYDKELKTWDGQPAQFEPAYVALFGTFAIAMGFSNKNKAQWGLQAPTHIHYCDNHDPHAVTFWGAGADRAFGVLMPRNAKSVTPAWQGAPEWTSEIYPNTGGL